VKIGIVVHHYDLSEGTGGYAVELLTRVARHHDVTLYAASVRAPVPEGVRVVRVPALRGRAYATVLSFPAAFAAVRARHDLIHAQGWVAPRADVVTAHIVLAAWREAAAAARIVPPPGERLFGGFVEHRERRLYQRARAVIAPSEKVKGELARCYDRGHGVTVVPHGFPAPRPVPSRVDARRRLGLPQDVFVVLYVGDPRKGLDRALRAIAFTERAHLLVVSRSARDPSERQGLGAGLGTRLHWAGPLDDPTPAYAAADVLVHPTIYDSFGLVVAEAMAAGLPVVVSRAAGVAELLEHGESAWILEPDGGADLGAALQALAADPALRDRLGRGGQARARRRSWDEVALETLAVYEQAAAR
jgi:UDP-glucose:(heptosyl)LPS alpha-1,3-glucosyltransferase